MFGISSSGKDQIASIVERMFDSIALQFIGDIPKLKHAKSIIISSKRNFGLADLFVQAMYNKTPNEIEADMLKSLLNSAFGYIDSLKSKTQSNVTERIDGLVKEHKLRGDKPNEQDIQNILDEELQKAKSHMKTIAESESTKLRNLGTVADISRVAANLGDSDPTVYFVVIKDSKTCKECLRLHTVDGTTPRLWLFSELKQSYHKRGEDKPSSFGLHPHCRCTLQYLAKSWGFDKQGKITYIGQNFDAYEDQRK